MTGQSFETFQNFQQEVFRLHGEKGFTQALTIINQEIARFPEHEGRILYWKVCFLSLAGEADSAVHTLTDALDRGHWFGETWLHGDPDLASLQNRPEFEALVVRSQQRAREAFEKTVPTRLDIVPGSETAAPYPLLIALHGNNSSAQLSADYWRPAGQQGWYVSLPMSTQTASSDTARWDDDEWTVRDVQRHYQEIIAQQPINSHQIIMGGFSMGGRQALALGLSGAIPASGIIALGPALGGGLERWLPYLPGAGQRGMKICLIVGDKDSPEFIYEPAQQLTEHFRQHGIPCQLRIYPEMGHVYPPDFATVLPDILAWMQTG